MLPIRMMTEEMSSRPDQVDSESLFMGIGGVSYQRMRSFLCCPEGGLEKAQRRSATLAPSTVTEANYSLQTYTCWDTYSQY